MTLYLDVSANEEGKPEYSIHGVDEPTLRDLMGAAGLLKFMLQGVLKLESFKGTDLSENTEIRQKQLLNFVQKAKKIMNATN